jgi:hypothetical protein
VSDLSSLRRAAVAALALAVLAPGRAAAQGFGDYEAVGRLEEARRQPTPLRVGPHGFTPSIIYKLFDVTTPHVFGALGAGYTDNVLRTDEEDPAGLVRSPFGKVDAGLRLDTQLTEHRIELEYRLGATEYSSSGSYDTFEQQVRLRVDLQFNDVTGHADVAYARTAYPQTIQLRGVGRADTTTATAWVDARWNRFGARVGLSGRRMDFLEGELAALDHRSVGPNLQAYFRVSPKLRALIEYNFEHVRYDERTDELDGYDLHQLRGGLDGEVTAKISVSLKVGYALQRVDSDAVGADEREYQGGVAELSARWEVLPRTTLGASVQRTLSPSLTSTFIISDDLELTVSQRLFEDKVRAEAHVGYTHAIISPGDHLNRRRAGASIIYQIRDWLSVAATYDYERLGSSAGPLEDYELHTVLLSIGAGL